MDATVANLRARIDLTAEQPFDVGSARIDPVSREAILPNSKERLQPQNLKVLIALKRRSGNVVTRDELVELCWNARFVADDVINRSISTLRRFAQRAGGFEIETIPRCGYRLVEGSTDSKNSRIGRMALAVGIIAAIGTASWLTGPGNSTAASQLVSILPLTAQADDVPAPEVATAAGDAIASALTDDGYSVRRPGSFEKHPAYIVEGNVIRTGNDLQATIRVEKRSGSLLLSSLQFGAPIQQAGTLGPQIGAQVAESLSLSSALESVESHRAIDPAMMTQLIEQTNFLAIGADPMPVFAIAQRLSRRAPNSAIAQLLLATSTGLALGDLPPSDRDGALRDGRYAASRALALAPNFGTSYIPWCLLHSQVRMEECETQLRTGLRVDPSAPFVSQYMSELLSGVGRSNEALQSARVGFADNPHMPTDIARLLRSLDAAGQPDVAERLYTQARLWWPKNRLFFWSRAGGMLEWGDFDHLEEFEAEPANVEEVRGYENSCAVHGVKGRQS